MYQYNSYHKIITAAIVIVWAIFHFTQRNDTGLYYDNGQVKREGAIVNSLNEGPWTWYHENGNVQIRGNFHKGQKNGVWKTYNETGELVSEKEYKMGVLLSERNF